MSTIYTIGFQRKPLSGFITLLHQSGIDAIIDVRLRNTSQLAGYTKRDDLSFLLREGFGISYEHHPDLAPCTDILDAYRQDKDWAAYEEHFEPLLVERQAEDQGRDILSRYRAPCLLCSEPTADQCHRRLVAEYWAKHVPDLTIIHLLHRHQVARLGAHVAGSQRRGIIAGRARCGNSWMLRKSIWHWASVGASRANCGCSSSAYTSCRITRLRLIMITCKACSRGHAYGSRG